MVLSVLLSHHILNSEIFLSSYFRRHCTAPLDRCLLSALDLYCHCVVRSFFQFTPCCRSIVRAYDKLPALCARNALNNTVYSHNSSCNLPCNCVGTLIILTTQRYLSLFHYLVKNSFGLGKRCVCQSARHFRARLHSGGDAAFHTRACQSIFYGFC